MRRTILIKTAYLNKLYIFHCLIVFACKILGAVILEKSFTYDHGLYLLVAIIFMTEISIPKNDI